MPVYLLLAAADSSLASAVHLTPVTSDTIALTDAVSVAIAAHDSV